MSQTLYRMFSSKSWPRYQLIKEQERFHDGTDSTRPSHEEAIHDYEPSRVPTHRSPSKKAKGLLAALLMSVSYLAGWFTRATVDVRLQGIQAIRPAVAFAGIPPGISEITEKVVFHNNHTFDIEREDDPAEAAWDAYFSRFISFDDEEVGEAGLPRSTRGPGGRQVYSVAAYHQLHCLHVIRYGWNELKAKGPWVLEEMYPGLEALREGYSVEGHVSHCLDMIRQALECHADPTLEPMMLDDGVTQEGNLASGWGGTPHMCRNFAMLTSWINAPKQHPLPSVEVFAGRGAHGHGHGGHGHGHGHHGGDDEHEMDGH